jgi:hypothetical protein
VLAEKMAATGAKGVKIKLGGRMRTTPDDERRTRALVPVIRRRLPAGATIYADGNGSYSAEEGIAIGRMLEEHGVAVMEEPCNFEDEDGTRRVNAALTKLVLAGDEQDTSMHRFAGWRSRTFTTCSSPISTTTAASRARCTLRRSRSGPGGESMRRDAYRTHGTPGAAAPQPERIKPGVLIGGRRERRGQTGDFDPRNGPPRWRGHPARGLDRSAFPVHASRMLAPLPVCSVGHPPFPSLPRR